MRLPSREYIGLNVLGICAIASTRLASSAARRCGLRVNGEREQREADCEAAFHSNFSLKAGEDSIP